MKYKDYMDLFTASPLEKKALHSKMERRANQIAAKGTASTPVIELVPNKQNTFKLHPKRWIAIATSIVLVAVLTPIIYFSVPRNNFVDNSLSLDYMKNLMVDVNGITAYSIRKDTENIENTAMENSSKEASVSLLSAKILDGNGKDNDNNSDGTKHRYYLYSTSESYEYGNVEYDSNSIQKVTFIKNTQVTEDVYDKNGKLIDSDRIISQDELDAQINKVYTTKQYTFLQFAPLVEMEDAYPYTDENGNIQYEQIYLRPDYDTYDENGVSIFDQTDYFSSDLTAAFVIDNTTGFIYKIENIYIEEFKGDFIVDNHHNYYLISTDEEHNLVFTDVSPNKDVRIRDIWLDNYGWVYVANLSLDYVDKDKKTIYIQDPEITGKWYCIDENANVYTYNKSRYQLINKIVDGEEVPFKPEGTIKNIKTLFPSLLTRKIELIGLHNGMYVYKPTILTHYTSGLGENCVAASINNTEFLGGLFVSPDNNMRYSWLDDDYDTLISQYAGKLYYKSVNLDDYQNRIGYLNEEDCTEFSDLPLEKKDFYLMPVGGDYYRVNNVYCFIGANKTAYYKIVKTSAGVKLEELTSKSYTGNVFIFQPINK